MSDISITNLGMELAAITRLAWFVGIKTRACCEKESELSMRMSTQLVVSGMFRVSGAYSSEGYMLGRSIV